MGKLHYLYRKLSSQNSRNIIYLRNDAHPTCNSGSFTVFCIL